MKDKIFAVAVAGSISAPAYARACSFCDAGADATRSFILVVFGLMTLGCLSMLLWAIVRGHFKNVEAPKHRMLELERTTEVRE